MQKQSEESTTISLMARLSCFSRHNSTRARDRIYALLGLSSDRRLLADHGIIVRYETSSEGNNRVEYCSWYDCGCSIVLDSIRAQNGFLLLLRLNKTFDQWDFKLTNPGNHISFNGCLTASWRIGKLDRYELRSLLFTSNPDW